MLIQENLSIEEKLRILSDAAKYDAACTSSGVGRKGKEGFLGNSRVDGICHSFASDGRCISLLKILFTSQSSIAGRSSHCSQRFHRWFPSQKYNISPKIYIQYFSKII